MAIRSFKCPDTEAVFHQRRVPRFTSVENVALRKLVQLDHATRLSDLTSPPGNRLEPLKADRRGQWSLRVNDRLRICFTWRNGHAEEVEIVDYH